MKYLQPLLALVLLVSCSTKTKQVTVSAVSKSIYPKVVYNSCAKVYAVKTDSNLFFGKEQIVLRGNSYLVLTSTGTYYGGIVSISINGEKLPPPPPDTVSIYELHDTLTDAWLGQEFQFKDSAEALRKYLAFAKEIQDTENIVNAPIKIQIKHYWDSAHEKHRKDSIANRGIFVADSIQKANQKRDDSIFQCQHSYN